MTEASTQGRTTLVSRLIKAPRQTVYQAFVDRDQAILWRSPDNMTAHMHSFDPREGGEFRMSLTYQKPEESIGGKSSYDTDTFHGRFVQLIPDEKIVEVAEFESPDPRFAGEMKITWSLTDIDGNTEVSVLCEDIPEGIRLEDNHTGSLQSLRKLAALVE